MTDLGPIAALADTLDRIASMTNADLASLSDADMDAMTRAADDAEKQAAACADIIRAERDRRADVEWERIERKYAAMMVSPAPAPLDASEMIRSIFFGRAA